MQSTLARPSVAPELVADIESAFAPSALVTDVESAFAPIVSFEEQMTPGEVFAEANSYRDVMLKAAVMAMKWRGEGAAQARNNLFNSIALGAATYSVAVNHAAFYESQRLISKAFEDDDDDEDEDEDEEQYPRVSRR